MKELNQISDEKLWSSIPGKSGLRRLEILYELSFRAYVREEYQHSLTLCESILDQCGTSSNSDVARISKLANLGAAHSARALGDKFLQDSFLQACLSVELNFQNQISVNILETMVAWASSLEDYESANKWVDIAIRTSDDLHLTTPLFKLKSRCLIGINQPTEAIVLLHKALSNPDLRDEKVSNRVELLELLAESLLINGQVKVALDRVLDIDALILPNNDTNRINYLKIRAQVLVENGLLKQAQDYLSDFISSPEYLEIKEKDSSDIDKILLEIASLNKDSQLMQEVNRKIMAREQKAIDQFEINAKSLVPSDAREDYKLIPPNETSQQNFENNFSENTITTTKKGINE